MHDQKKHLKQIFRAQDVQSHPVACMVSQLDEVDDDTVTISSLNNTEYPNTSKLGTTPHTMLVCYIRKSHICICNLQCMCCVLDFYMNTCLTIVVVAKRDMDLKLCWIWCFHTCVPHQR